MKATGPKMLKIEITIMGRLFPAGGSILGTLSNHTCYDTIDVKTPLFASDKRF